MSIASIKTFLSYWFNKSMTEPDVNSRLVFLVSGIGSIGAILLLVCAFILSEKKEGYDYMVVAVSGGAVGHGVSRYLTKKNADGSGDADTPKDK
jgi:hypothetical protein